MPCSLFRPTLTFFSKMKILITSYRFYPDVGGIETITSLLASHFVSSGHQVKVVTGSLCEEDDIFPFLIYRCPSPIQLLRLYHWSDIILQNNIEVRRLWPLLFLKKPLVIGIQTWIRSSKSIRQFSHLFKLQFLRLAINTIACSEAIKVDTSSNATVIGNPYDEGTFKLLNSRPRNKSIVFLGRLVSDKGADILLRAFANLANSDWKLTIIGDGPEESYLRDMCIKLNISSAVTFTGILKGHALSVELNSHEIMVVPSLWNEPFGVVALEGIACGCALLVSDGGGLPDAVGEAGILFKRGNQNDLTDKLQTLVNDPNLRLSLRSNAPIHLARHKINVVGDIYLSVLMESIARFKY